MLALKGVSVSFLRRISGQNPVSSSQFFFTRGFATTLFVKDIAFSTEEDKFAEAFSKFGTIEETKIIRNKVSNRSKGYGYITFATRDDALKALEEMNGKLLDGRVIFVDLAKPSRIRSGGMPIARGPPEPPMNNGTFELPTNN